MGRARAAVRRSRQSGIGSCIWRRSQLHATKTMRADDYVDAHALRYSKTPRPVDGLFNLRRPGLGLKRRRGGIGNAAVCRRFKGERLERVVAAVSRSAKPYIGQNPNEAASGC